MAIAHVTATSCFAAAVFDRLCWQLAFGTFLPERDGGRKAAGSGFESTRGAAAATGKLVGSVGSEGGGV